MPVSEWFLGYITYSELSIDFLNLSEKTNCMSTCMCVIALTAHQMVLAGIRSNSMSPFFGECPKGKTPLSLYFLSLLHQPVIIIPPSCGLEITWSLTFREHMKNCGVVEDWLSIVVRVKWQLADALIQSNVQSLVTGGSDLMDMHTGHACIVFCMCTCMRMHHLMPQNISTLMNLMCLFT